MPIIERVLGSTPQAIHECFTLAAPPENRVLPFRERNSTQMGVAATHRQQADAVALAQQTLSLHAWRLYRDFVVVDLQVLYPNLHPCTQDQMRAVLIRQLKSIRELPGTSKITGKVGSSQQDDLAMAFLLGCYGFNHMIVQR